MLGRGTRLCPDIHKTHFTIFDCFGGTLIEFFKNTTEFSPEPPQKDVVPIEKVIENIWQNIDRDYNVNVLVKRLHRIDKNMSGDAREKFETFIPDGDMGKFASGLKDSIKKDFTKTMEILRNKEFQELLVNYPRAKSSFIIAYDTVDTVTSEWVFKVGDDVVKPEDYLLSFERFVKENPEQIEAIEIILHRPKEWKTDALNELRDKMKKSSFKEADLQRAHKIVYNKALADIISMIKRAAEEQSPIYTAQERVEYAMRMFMRERDFSEEQIKWLELIRNHLTENLTIDVEDFEYAPIFTRMGGKSKAKKVFGGEFDSIISKLNELIAA
jgi:type I restriction enzyme R subunit